MTRLSIVVPCYNEEASIATMIDRLDGLVSKLSASYGVEVVVVDDGSSDATARRTRELASRRPWLRLVQHGANRGLGRAIETASREATGDVVGMLDADCTFAPELLPSLLERLDSGYDVVIGSPYHPEGRVENVKFLRMLVSKGLSRVYRFITASSIYSFSGIFRVYRREVLLSVDFNQSGFAMVTEVILQAHAAGYRIAEVPVTLTCRQEGQSKLRFWSEVGNHLRLLWRALRFYRLGGRSVFPRERTVRVPPAASQRAGQPCDGDGAGPQAGVSAGSGHAPPRVSRTR